MKNRLSAYSIYLIYAGASAFFFSLVFTVSQIYRIDKAHLNPLQLVLVGTVLEASCFIFEIPTGIVADMRSRKLSVIIGLVLIGGAFILEGSMPIFMVILASQALWGLGYTFTSGADEAWIADELGGKGLDRTFLKGAQIGQLFSLAGILVSTAIGTIVINLPMIIGGALFILLAVFLAFFMGEEGFIPTPAEDRDSWSQMAHTFMMGMKFIKGKPILVVMVGISLLYGLYSEGFDRLWTAHFMEDTVFPAVFALKPVIWFGIINAAAMLLSIAAVEYIKRNLERTGRLEKVWILTGINIIMVASIIIFGLAGNFTMAALTYLSFYIVRTTNEPIYRSWLNESIESRVRATVLSTYGQMDALGQIVGGPIIGYLAYKVSIAVGIVTSGIILSFVLLFYLYAGKRMRGIK